LSVNDKLTTYIISLFKGARKATSPLNKSYNPEKALDNLQKYFDSYKSGAYTGNLSKEDYIVQRNPYNSTNLIQFEENARAEPMTRSALRKQANYTFAKGIKTVLDTMYDDFETTEKKAEAVQSIMSKQEYIKAKQVVDKVSKRCNTRFWFKAGSINAKTFGRSALLKEYVGSKDGHPTSLCLLYSKLLGDVYNYKNEPSKIAYIEYNTNQEDKYNNKIYYQPEDLVYFTNFDIGLSPNTIGYGYSEIEPIKDIGETNRVINEEDNKEFARQGWAGNVLLKIPNMKNATEVENLLSNWEPGRAIAITSDITAEPLERPNNLADVTELNIQNDRRILRSTEVPTPTFFEDVTNRATVQFILHAYKETHVEQERIWLKDIIEPQWIYPIWAKELNKTPEEMAELDAKLTLEFIEYNFDTFEQKVNVWLPIVQAGYITIERFLEEIGYPQLAEEYKKNQKEIQKQRIENAESLGFGNPAFNKFGKGPKDDATENFGSSSKKTGGLSDSGGSDL
jgi:hypothetical protein